VAIGSALTSAMSGLRIARAGMDIVAQNVANADNAGYTRKSLSPRTQVIGERVLGVRNTIAQRTLDQLVQQSLRTEVAGGAYTQVRASTMQRLDALYGPPGSDAAFERVFNRFTTALQDLSTSPESPIARSRVLAEANVLTQRVNGISQDIQGLRLEAEGGIADAVGRANDALSRITEIDRMIVAESANNREPVNLMDQRDQAIGELARLMDIRVNRNSDNSVSLFTRSGVLLYDRQPVTLEFDQRASIGPSNLYDADPTKRGVGTIMLKSPSGLEVDLIAQGAFRTGELAGLISLRDEVLPEAQDQLDAFAAALSQSLSDKTVSGSAAALGPQTGFQVPVGQMRPGDVITLNVVQGGNARTISIVRVDDPGALPLDPAATPDPNDQVIGISFSGGAGAAAAAIQAALGPDFTVDSPAAGTIRFLDDGAAATTDIAGASVRVTESSLNGGTPSLPMFTDGAIPFSNGFDGAPQLRGFAGRIGVNAALVADPTRLVGMAPGPVVNAGDPTRPNALLDRLTQAARLVVAPGIGSDGAPASATVQSLVQRIVTAQGQQAELGQRLAEGQEIVVSGLEERFAQSAKVNVDEEMARLIELQQTFQASARILSVVDEMMKTLLQS